jgi:hypothetical protein
LLVTFEVFNRLKYIDMKQREQGAAAIRIDLRGGVITVYHGVGGHKLETFDAYDGAWNMIWDGIRNAKNNNNE